MSDWLNGKKTYIIAVLIALQALITVISGDITIAEFLQSEAFLQLLSAFGLASLRHGVAKTGTGDGS